MNGLRPMLLAKLTLSWLCGVALAAAPEATVTLNRTSQAVELKIQPPPGTHLNYDGPWKLEVQGSLPLLNKSGVFGIEAFNKTSQVYSLPLEHKADASAKGNYTLTYFYCATDNSWCKRAQSKGEM